MNKQMAKGWDENVFVIFGVMKANTKGVFLCLFCPHGLYSKQTNQCILTCSFGEFDVSFSTTKNSYNWTFREETYGEFGDFRELGDCMSVSYFATVAKA